MSVTMMLALTATSCLAATAAPEAYTFSLSRALSASTVTLSLPTNASFESITSDAPYRVGNLILTYYKLNREPISKYALAKNTYAYVTLDSNTTVVASDGVTSTITFDVDASWVTSSGASVQQIALFVYDEANSVWRKLDTQYLGVIGTNSNVYRYSATSNLFGYFAIALDRPLIPAAAALTQGSSVPGVNTADTLGKNAINTTANSSATIATTTPDTPQNVDPGKEKVEVVYPLMDNNAGVTASTSRLGSLLGNWRTLVGYGLLIFALAGTIGIGTTVVQRQISSKRIDRLQTTPPSQSVGELLTRLQATRNKPIVGANASQSEHVDVNKLLARVNARYSKTEKAEQLSRHGAGDLQNSTTPTSAGLAQSIFAQSHVDQLKNQVSALEPEIVRKYALAGLRAGKTTVQIKQELLANDIDESVIDRVMLII